MEYLIREVIETPEREFIVARGKKDFETYPSKFDQVTIKIFDKEVKTEIVNIENNTIFVQKITL